MPTYQTEEIDPIKTAPQFSQLSTTPLIETIPIIAPLQIVRQSYFVYLKLKVPITSGFKNVDVIAEKLLEIIMF